MVVLLASFRRSTLPAVGELADIYADPSRTVRDAGSSPSQTIVSRCRAMQCPFNETALEFRRRQMNTGRLSQY